MKIYLKVVIAPVEQEEAEILMAALTDYGFYAFEEGEESLTAYIVKQDYDEQALRSLIPADVLIRIEEIEDKNWNSEWESAFEPVIVDDFVGIRAGFHETLKDVQHEIIITPKMSFGTGHHATTEMMVRLMKDVDFKGKIAIDFGTGTGVLAILAEKLGAANIFALDNDEWSIENAGENVKNNHCEAITLSLASDISAAPKADIVLANINLNVLLKFAASIADKLNPNGLVLLSGILESDRETILKTYKVLGFSELKEVSLRGWIAILLKKSTEIL
ncbi:MAG: 50S ribosomal protein L11 methyltransferase [Chitinophagaceae bacterium]|nr:50S ribosomal protein L11 methyltransferase [Chitinophagaceae bacterium]